MFSRLIIASIFALTVNAYGVPAPSDAGRTVAFVRAIESNPVADILVLKGGADVGLRQGMLCRVVREGRELAEIIVVEVRFHHSAALLSGPAPELSLRPGDNARVRLQEL